MKLVINGEESTIPDTVSNVSSLLKSLGVKKKHLGFELNGDIIEPSLFEKTPVKEMDIIEIISFVGGG